MEKVNLDKYKNLDLDLGANDDLRQIALAEHLGIELDQIVPCSYDSQLLIVSPAFKKFGPGPSDALKAASHVRVMLGALKIHDVELSEITDEFYNSVDKLARQNLGEGKLFPTGREYQDFVNPLYMMIPRKDKGYGNDEYERALRAAWEGDNVLDWRRPQPTNSGEYLVVTDSEADILWDEALDSYIDDCMEIPDSLEPYFDREKWKQDARIDGRAHSLARYDGHEHWKEVNGETFYIYRQN